MLDIKNQQDTTKLRKIKHHVTKPRIRQWRQKQSLKTMEAVAQAC